jgi:hypothetical protein
MARYEVFHAIMPNYGLGPHPRWPDAYQLVVSVEARNLEEVFELTNLWPETPRIRYLVRDPRSTSVGDVVVDPHGRAYRCESCSWSRIPTTSSR